MVVLAAIFVAVILVIMFGIKPAFLKPTYTIELAFPKAPGIAKNTPVRKDGVPIGRVSNIRLRDKGGVVLTLKIDEGRKLYMNEVCYLTTSSLVTGDAILEFVARSRGQERRTDSGRGLPVQPRRGRERPDADHGQHRKET